MTEAALARVWERVAASLAARREELDGVLDGLLAEGAVVDALEPVRVLVASDTDAARQLLRHRLEADDRFVVVGQADTPQHVLGEGVASLPDVVLVKLASADRAWLHALGELTAWSPRTRMVAVSGIHADHLAQLVLAPPVVRELASGRPAAARVAAGLHGRRPPRVEQHEAPTVEPTTAPRSLIHEVMRQMGIPVRARASR